MVHPSSFYNLNLAFYAVFYIQFYLLFMLSTAFVYLSGTKTENIFRAFFNVHLLNYLSLLIFTIMSISKHHAISKLKNPANVLLLTRERDFFTIASIHLPTYGHTICLTQKPPDRQRRPWY